MKYKVHENKPKYSQGNYYLKSNGEVFQIIFDSGRGFTLLSVNDGRVESEFHETLDDLIQFTTITEMRPLKQVLNAEFEVF